MINRYPPSPLMKTAADMVRDVGCAGGRLREAIQRLDQAIPKEAPTAIRDFRIVRFERSTP